MSDPFILAPNNYSPPQPHPSSSSTSSTSTPTPNSGPSASAPTHSSSSPSAITPTTSRPRPSGTPTSHNHNGPHVCSGCGRKYSRPEHLARHIQTHTLGKRFPCLVCGQAFARTDLLRRHQQNHSNTDGTKKRRAGSSAFSAGRVSHACRQCSAARVKCEEVKPCTRCRGRGLECEYNAQEAAVALHHAKTTAAAVAQRPLPEVTQGLNRKMRIETERDPMEGVTQVLPHIAGPQEVGGGPHGNDNLGEEIGIRSQEFNQNPMGMAERTLGRADGGPMMTPSESLCNQQQQLAQAVVTMNYASMTTSLMPQPVLSQPPQPSMVVDMNHLPFSGFLRDIIYEPDLHANHTLDAATFPILDFCSDASLELNETDYGLLDYLNLSLDLPPDSDRLSSFEEAANLIKVRHELASMWTHDNARCAAESEDNCWTNASSSASTASTPHLDVGDLRDIRMPAMEESRHKLYSILPPSDKLTLSGRDGVLAMILATCKSPTMSARVSSSFPSLEVLDGFAHIYLAGHLCMVSNFVHFPSLRLREQGADWTAAVVAAGAVRTPVATIRRFGYAVQEAVRISTALRLENSSQISAELDLVQATVILQDLGLWSSNRSKMVAAEAYLSFPIHVMRCRGKFQRSAYPLITVHPADTGAILHEKWRTWYHRESWKRLIFHCYMRDCHVSMISMTNPAMSYFEMSLPLPERSELWGAKTAEEWKEWYMKVHAGQSKRPPCVGDLLRDITILTENTSRLDVQFSVSIYLSAMWALIHEYHQLSGVHRSRAFSAQNLASNSNTLLSERHQEIYKELRVLQQLHALDDLITPQQTLMVHLLMMHLHISMNDMFMFSGRGGEEQMRRAYPILKQWSESTEAREALWHAAQTLRYAKMFPTMLLRDFWCIATFQAGVTLWTYGVVTGASRKRRAHNPSSSGSSLSASPIPHIPGRSMNEPLFLDGEEESATMRWLSMGQGKPLIRMVDGTKVEPDDAAGCMGIVEGIFVGNHGEKKEEMPALVWNLRQLTKQMATVARQVHS